LPACCHEGGEGELTRSPDHRTVAWFHCFSGIAGDMALGSLIDAGADMAELRSLLERLPITGWVLDVEEVLRAGVAATRAIVIAPDDGVVRTYAHISGLVDEARLPGRVADRAQAAFAALAEAEGQLHRRPAAQVHFHEVGGVDAIIDVVGTCAALELLDVDIVQASPVAVGTGMVRATHGALPNPVPAVVQLLRGAPTYGRDVQIELTTPTGAALLAGLASSYGPLPPMTVAATGFGAGSADIDGLPNMTQVVIGRMSADASPATADDASAGQPVVLVEVNVDDATGETLAHAVEAVLSAGANDAWVTPIVMKKGRPAYTVSAVADPALAEQVASVLVAETGSLGVRSQELQRRPRARSGEEVDVDGVPVRVKVSAGRVKVEHDDAVRAARRTGRPLREVVVRAEAAWLTRTSDGTEPRRPVPGGPDQAG
jgi:uncharacterized protein (TIGR00299 family) protein